MQSFRHLHLYVPTQYFQNEKKLPNQKDATATHSIHFKSDVVVLVFSVKLFAHRNFCATFAGWWVYVLSKIYHG